MKRLVLPLLATIALHSAINTLKGKKNNYIKSE